jgi:hypothetical protein
MNIFIPTISSLITGLTIFIITRWYNHREKKKSALETMREDMIEIKSMLEGHKSFSEALQRHDKEIEIRREVCETNHRWDGKERRRSIS